MPLAGELSPKDVEELMRAMPGDGAPCVSLYMPTLRGGDTRQNSIRLKNLLRQAEELLAGWQPRREREELLAPARQLLEDMAFWQSPDEGLAVFSAPALFRSWRLPLPFHELATVEERFHLKPLFPLFNDDGIFYILTLSLKHVRLLRANRWGVEELDLGAVPKSFREAMGDLNRRTTQFPPTTRTQVGVARSPIFHGHGTAEDEIKNEIRQYFRRVDGGLPALHLDRGAPLVLAGVDYLLPIYREATNHPKVMEEGLTGNADGLEPAELRAAAWEIVEPVFGAARRRGAERYRELAGTGLASGQLQEVLRGAHDGRVELLFAASGVRCWGTYDPVRREARQAEGPGMGREDLVDLAAVQSWLHRGKVFVTEPNEMPDGRPVAAVFRY